MTSISPSLRETRSLMLVRSLRSSEVSTVSWSKRWLAATEPWSMYLS